MRREVGGLIVFVDGVCLVSSMKSNRILAEFLHFLSQTDRQTEDDEWPLSLSLQEIVCSQPLFAQLTQVELIKIYVHQEQEQQQQARQLPVLSTNNCLLLATKRREEEMKNKR